MYSEVCGRKRKSERERERKRKEGKQIFEVEVTVIISL